MFRYLDLLIYIVWYYFNTLPETAVLCYNNPMAFFYRKSVQDGLKVATGVLGLLTLAVVVYGYSQPTDLEVEGRLLPSHMRGQDKWVTILPRQILSGATLPANTNVVIYFPENSPRITRKVVFGHRGTRVRYWGYCFPDDYQQKMAMRGGGFPGTMFLSEAERDHRKARLMQERRRTFSIFNNLTERDLNDTYTKGRQYIRHQQEIFYSEMKCYVMSEKPLPVGIDIDGDGANGAIEKQFGSDFRNPDTDGDGVLDGLEIFRLGSHPTKRDTDGDGLIDGIEDRNHNGKWDIGETFATKWDSDEDGICDGLCKVDRGMRLRGEDKNLNGRLDKREHDPTKKDTDGDGILDDHEIYLCEMAGGDDC